MWSIDCENSNRDIEVSSAYSAADIAGRAYLMGLLRAATLEPCAATDSHR
jgi:hypothetical protein